MVKCSNQFCLSLLKHRRFDQTIDFEYFDLLKYSIGQIGIPNHHDPSSCVIVTKKGRVIWQ